MGGCDDARCDEERKRLRHLLLALQEEAKEDKAADLFRLDGVEDDAERERVGHVAVQSTGDRQEPREGQRRRVGQRGTQLQQRPPNRRLAQSQKKAEIQSGQLNEAELRHRTRADQGGLELDGIGCACERVSSLCARAPPPRRTAGRFHS